MTSSAITPELITAWNEIEVLKDTIKQKDEIFAAQYLAYQELKEKHIKLNSLYNTHTIMRWPFFYRIVKFFDLV